MAPRTYKIRKFTNGRSKEGATFTNYSLTIPAPIAEKLPDDMLFECELTDEGILFRPAQASPEQVELPAWAKANGSSGSARSRPRAQTQAA